MHGQESRSKRWAERSGVGQMLNSSVPPSRLAKKASALAIRSSTQSLWSDRTSVTPLGGAETVVWRSTTQASSQVRYGLSISSAGDT
jgi:hypothetical protein